MLKTPIEKFLFRNGFHVQDVRRIAVYQVEIMLASLLALPLGASGLAFVLGTALGSLNFLALARVLQEVVYLRRGAVAVQLFSFYGRLAITAAALFVLIAYAKTPVSALLFGLSTVLVSILLWGMTQFLGKKSKEA